MSDQSSEQRVERAIACGTEYAQFASAGLQGDGLHLAVLAAAVRDLRDENARLATLAEEARDAASAAHEAALDATAERDRLREALREIRDGFDGDELQDSADAVDQHRDIARAALARSEEQA